MTHQQGPPDDRPEYGFDPEGCGEGRVWWAAALAALDTESAHDHWSADKALVDADHALWSAEYLGCGSRFQRFIRGAQIAVEATLDAEKLWRPPATQGAEFLRVLATVVTRPHPGVARFDGNYWSRSALLAVRAIRVHCDDVAEQYLAEAREVAADVLARPEAESRSFVLGAAREMAIRVEQLRAHHSGCAGVGALWIDQD